MYVCLCDVLGLITHLTVTNASMGSDISPCGKEDGGIESCSIPRFLIKCWVKGTRGGFGRVKGYLDQESRDGIRHQGIRMGIEDIVYREFQIVIRFIRVDGKRGMT